MKESAFCCTQKLLSCVGKDFLSSLYLHYMYFSFVPCLCTVFVCILYLVKSVIFVSYLHIVILGLSLICFVCTLYVYVNSNIFYFQPKRFIFDKVTAVSVSPPFRKKGSVSREDLLKMLYETSRYL